MIDSSRIGLNVSQSEWHWTGKKITVRVFYPLAGQVHSPEKVTLSSDGSQRDYICINVESHFKQHGKYSLTFSYTPNAFNERLSYALELNKSDAPFYW